MYMIHANLLESFTCEFTRIYFIRFQYFNWVTHWLYCITVLFIVLLKAKIRNLFVCLSFFLATMSYIRNVNVETCAREKVGKERDALVET